MKNIYLNLILCTLLISSSFASGTHETKKKTALSEFETKMHYGIVKSVLDAGVYTYVQVASKKETLWVAVSKTKISVGESVGFAMSLPMKNFKSKTLKKTFDLVYFTAGLKVAGQKAKTTDKMSSKKKKKKRSSIKPGSISKADFSIFDIWAKRSALKGKEILIRGKVVKVTLGVMKRNWIHLQDGTGTDKFYDLVVTSNEAVKVGEIILLRGIVTTNKDFGYGYFYKVLIENAKIIKK